MKKFFITIIFCCLFKIHAQTDSVEVFNGLKMGVIPAFSFDNDLGIKYGAIINLFDYGDGNVFPDYNQYLFLRLINTTKRTTYLQAVLESEQLLNKANSILEISYLRDNKLDFYGFNGSESVYNKNLINVQEPDLTNNSFYSHGRSWIRLRADIQKYLFKKELRIITGITYNFIKINSGLEKKTFSNLYTNYINWGLIKKNEKNGGNITYLTLGLIYDTRNDKCYCTNGRWFESMIIISPDKISDFSFSKLILTYRHYENFLRNKFDFSFRLSSQNKLSGNIPFFMLPVYFNSRLNQDGIGGAFNLRGVERNRIAANGYAVGNFELRYNIKNMYILKKHLKISVSVFHDLAFITQKYNIDKSNVPDEYMSLLFHRNDSNNYMTSGIGLYFIFNSNNIISVNYGKPYNKDLGNGGLYVGSSLLF